MVPSPEDTDVVRVRSPTGSCFPSVVNGDAGSPSLLKSVRAGLFDHPYRTRAGSETDGLLTITVSPLIVAVAQI